MRPSPAPKTGPRSSRSTASGNTAQDADSAGPSAPRRRPSTTLPRTRRTRSPPGPDSGARRRDDRRSSEGPPFPPTAATLGAPPVSCPSPCRAVYGVRPRRGQAESATFATGCYDRSVTAEALPASSSPTTCRQLARGDRPLPRLDADAPERASPHTRGWTSRQLAAGCQLPGATPARAGNQRGARVEREGKDGPEPELGRRRAGRADHHPAARRRAQVYPRRASAGYRHQPDVQRLRSPQPEKPRESSGISLQGLRAYRQR